MLMMLYSLVVVVLVARLILKKVPPVPVLFFGAAALLLYAAYIGGTEIVEKKPTGVPVLDFFNFIASILSERTAALGLMIMSIAGFGAYMEHTGASRALVRLLTKPLSLCKSPYVLVGLGTILAVGLNMVIGSATGLGVLLGITLLPVLRAGGVTAPAAAAVVVTSGCFDFGPTQGNLVLSAKLAGVDASHYFVNFQLPIVVVTTALLAVFHAFYQRRCDRREELTAGTATPEVQDPKAEAESDLPPRIYVVLPLVPLVLVLGFSKTLGSPIVIEVVPAMFISLTVALICELVRYRTIAPVFAGVDLFFSAMGKSFAGVVSLIIAGEMFGNGLKKIGAVDAIVAQATALGFGSVMLTIIVLAIVAGSAVLMGSGNASFYAFADIVPNVAKSVGVPAARMLVPIQLAAGIGRTMSPIAAVIVAVAQFAGIQPVDLVRRTIPPMLFALVVSFICSLTIVGG